MEDKHIYHEKQILQFCLLHALNNLLQEKDSFTRAELDAIADKLVLDDPNRVNWSPLSLVFKPHHNALTGNYDVNVLIAALEARNKRVVWHDRRSGACSINLAEENLIGFMLNIPVRKFGGLWRGRHWIALRSIHNIWYNLDSDLSAPKAFQLEEVTDYLDYTISHGLPEVSMNNTTVSVSYRTLIPERSLDEVWLGKLGKIMVEMLPDDLAFTIFVPSEEAFGRVLKLRANDSLDEHNTNDTFAILSRVMGFSAVPRHLPSRTVPLRKEISFESISGFRLYAWRASDGVLIVNNVRSEQVDLRKSDTIVHIMNGVIMDAEFQQSFYPDYEG